MNTSLIFEEKMLAKWLFWIGIAFLIGSLIVYLFAKWGIPLGKLPLDFSWNFGAKNKVSVFFPLGTCIVISGLLSLFSYLFFKFKR